MTIQELKKILGIKNADLAIMFGYKNAISFNNSSRRPDVERGILKLYELIMSQRLEKSWPDCLDFKPIFYVRCQVTQYLFNFKAYTWEKTDLGDDHCTMYHEAYLVAHSKPHNVEDFKYSPQVFIDGNRLD